MCHVRNMIWQGGFFFFLSFDDGNVYEREHDMIARRWYNYLLPFIGCNRRDGNWTEPNREENHNLESTTLSNHLYLVGRRFIKSNIADELTRNRCKCYVLIFIFSPTHSSSEWDGPQRHMHWFYESFISFLVHMLKVNIILPFALLHMQRNCFLHRDRMIKFVCKCYFAILFYFPF